MENWWTISNLTVKGRAVEPPFPKRVGKFCHTIEHTYSPNLFEKGEVSLKKIPATHQEKITKNEEKGKEMMYIYTRDSTFILQIMEQKSKMN